MKVNQLIEKLLDKWIIKLICLAAAIFLYVFHQVSLVETKTFTVPLHIIEEGNLVHTSDVQKYISVIIKANREEISTIHVNDINAYVTLNYQIDKGNYELPVNIDLTERILSLDPIEIKVKPENINLSCEEKVTKFIPVEPSFVGDPAYGYEIDDFSIEPGIIEISGPESLVNKTTKLQTTQVDISGLNKRTDVKVGFVNINPNINFDKNVIFDVEVNVKPLITEKLYSNIPVSVKNLSHEFVIDTNLPVISFSVKGALSYLDNFKISSDAVQIDMSKISSEGKYEIPIKIILPQALTLVSKSDEKIILEVSRVQQLFENTEVESTEANISEQITDTL